MAICSWGVINLIMKEMQEKFHTNLLLSYRSFHIKNYQMEHGGNLSKFSYYCTANKGQSDMRIGK